MKALFSGRWRWVWRIFLGLVALLLVIVVAGEIIFRTGLPRKLVISEVEKQTGLRFTADSLSTGFMGHTTLHGVTISLPLADQPFLQISELKLDHTWLPGLLLGTFNIEQIDLNNPNLTLRQGASKTWNFQEVAQLLTPQNPGPSDQNQTLPAVHIQDATVVIADSENRSTTIEHLQFDGDPHGSLLWECHALIPGHADITGKIATGRLWAHEINFHLTDLKPLISPWVHAWPESAAVHGQWSGRIDSGKLVGRLSLSQAGFNALALSGPIQIATTDDGAELQPTGAVLQDINNASFDTQFTGGSIVINSTGLQLKNLSLRFPQGAANIDGNYQFAASTAAFHATWRDLEIPSTALHSGEIQFNFNAANGRPRFTATLQCHGQLHGDTWDTNFALAGGGDLHDLIASLTAQKLVITSAQGQTMDLSGFVAEIGANTDGLILRDLQLADSNSFSGTGGYSFSRKTAWFALDGRGLPIPGHAAHTADLDLNVWLDPTRVHLTQLYLSSGLFGANLYGEYVFNLPQPVQAHLTVLENPPLEETEDFETPTASSFQSDVDISGTAVPLALNFTGTANGTDIQFHHRSFGDLSVELDGQVQNDQVCVASQNIQLLGGTWTVNGTWPVRDSLFRIDNLSVQHLSLPLVTGNPEIVGSLDGKWSIDVRELSRAGITVDGSAAVHNLDINENPDLGCTDIQIPKMRVANGWAKTGPMDLTQKCADASGSAKVRIVTALTNPTRLWINLDSKSWPVMLNPERGAVAENWGNGIALITAKSKLEVDLASKSALGNINLAVDGRWNSKALANLQTSIDIDRRTLNFSNVKINSLDAVATGKAKIDIDNPYQARADLAWNEINLDKLTGNSPDLKDLTGHVSGSLKIAPATDPRALGPLALKLQLNSHDVHFKKVAVGNFQAAAYLAPDRFVLADTPDHPTQIAIAGGFIHFWGRISKHQEDVYQSLIGADLKNLDLNTVMPAGAKTGETPGSLNGQIIVVSEPRHPNLAFGQGSLRIEKSDLAGAGPIAFMYNLLHIFHNPNKPQGYGTIDFTVQGRNALITSMRYFDRGSEIRLTGNINDLLHLPHSPVNLVAIGSARPLISVNIPGVADIDQALNAVQSNALVVHITGWFDQPKESLMSLSEVGQDLKNLLFGGSANGDVGQ